MSKFLAVEKEIGGNKVTFDLKAYLAELIGTMFLVFGICMAVVNAENGAGNIISIAFTHFLVLSVSVFIFGDISGSHINPAVSLSMLVLGLMDIFNFIIYVIF